MRPYRLAAILHRLRVPPRVWARVDRLPDLSDALVATHSRQRALDVGIGAVAMLLVGVLVTWHAARLVPVRTALVGLDALAIVGTLAAWRRLDARFGGRVEPSAALLRDLLVIVGFVLGGLFVADALLFPRASAKDVLLDDRWSTSPLVTVVFAAGAVAVVVAVSAVLYRLRMLLYDTPTRGVRRAWTLMLAAFALDALLRLPALHAPPWITTLESVLLGLLMLWNAGHQGWIVPLRQGDKWSVVAVGFALGVVALLAQDYAAPLLGVLSPGVMTLVASALLYAAMCGFIAFTYALILLPSTRAVRRQVDERRALRSLTDLMGDAFDRQRLSGAVAHAPVDAGLADRAWLVLGTGADARVAAAYGIDSDEAAARTTPTFLDTTRWHGPTAASVLSLPLVVGGQTTGALVAERTRDAFFTRDDAESLGVFASQAAFAFEHARLFEQTVEKERLRREMDIARAVQNRLLPQTLPTLDGLTIAASSVPALDVGGDYYDVIRTAAHGDGAGDDGLALVVADVSGKGTSAAFFMAEMQGAMRALAPGAADPVACLADANRVLAGVLDPGHFVTALLGLLRVGADGVATLTSARAGHCPLAVAAPGEAVRFVRSPGLGLGLDRRGRQFAARTESDTRALTPGTAVVFVTDGVVESRSPSGDEYGYERLAAAIEQARAVGAGTDADALHDALLANLTAFVDGGDYGDDMTLLTLVWHGRDATALSGAPGAP